MSQLQDAIRVMRELLGDANVISAPNEISEYEKSTFHTDQRIPFVVLPGSTDEVRAVVQTANRFKLPIYPISRGRNWGLGSRVPVHSGNCVVDLKRMDAIVEFDEHLSYITVQPGVTFRQVADFLCKRNSELYLTAIGAPEDSSLIGNALERGDGFGPMGEKVRFCCGLEAVLPSGEVVNTGNETFTNSSTSKLSKFGLGPDIESLFFQSNLAIITKMTFWLALRPPQFQSLIFGIRNSEDLQHVCLSMRRLLQLGILNDASFAIWNIYRFLAAQMQYPWEQDGEAKASPEQLLEHLPATWRSARWVGLAGLYSASGRLARAEKKLVKEALKGKVTKLIFVDAFTANLARWLKVPLRKITGVDIEKNLDTLYFESVFLGHPPSHNTPSIYWRKRMPAPADMDPNRDRCGLHWICVLLPYDGAHVVRISQIIEETVLRYRLEPQYMFWAVTQWLLKSFIVISYDRDIEHEEAGALDCYHDLLTTLHQAGYTSSRIGIQSMQTVTPDQQSHIDFIQRIKNLLDPNDILAPGRYDFRHRWRL